VSKFHGPVRPGSMLFQPGLLTTCDSLARLIMQSSSIYPSMLRQTSCGAEMLCLVFVTLVIKSHSLASTGGYLVLILMLLPPLHYFFKVVPIAVKVVVMTQSGEKKSPACDN